MAKRQTKKLDALSVSRKKLPGHFSDGDGLYLQVSDAGTKSWVFRFTLNSKTREMGLGPYPTIDLSSARVRAHDCRVLLVDGIDPIDFKRQAKMAEIQKLASSKTFKECAEEYIKLKKAGWKNDKHAAQWTSTLECYAYPVLGNLYVSMIDTGHVLRVLQPIWETKNETATRLRSRIECVLAAASTLGYRDALNPARWKGHLENNLAKPSKVQRVVHHPALPFVELAAFLTDLKGQVGTAARLLEFIIYTACRTSEAIGARWDEIDRAKGVWTIPAARIKGGREHRVPLTEPILQILRLMQDQKQNDFVFPGGKAGRPFSNMACLSLLKRMGRSDLTVHGFRSTFRDWAAEQTNFPREVAEMALAHAISDKTEAAYRRGELFQKRTKMMTAWAEYGSRARRETVTATRQKRMTAA